MPGLASRPSRLRTRPGTDSNTYSSTASGIPAARSVSTNTRASATKMNRRRFIFVALALGLVLWLRAAGVPVAVLLYVLLSVPGRVRSRDGIEPSPTSSPQ